MCRDIMRLATLLRSLETAKNDVTSAKVFVIRGYIAIVDGFLNSLLSVEAAHYHTVQRVSHIICNLYASGSLYIPK
jgi:hypothetical protein